MDTDIMTEDIDDCNWSMKKIVKLYKRAAMLAGYTEEEISRFKELNDRTLMLQSLDYLRKTGWRCVGESDWLKIVKISFCSLAELDLKLTIRGMM